MSSHDTINIGGLGEAFVQDVSYKTLTDFIPKLQGIEYGELYPKKQTGDGTMEKPYQMPYMVYCDVVNEFVDTVYAFENQYPQFDLCNYISILKEQGIEWDEDAMTKADVSSLDGQVVVALVLAAVRSERFCDGELKYFLENGCIQKWLKRLVEIEAPLENNNDIIAKVKDLPYDANEWVYEQSEDRKSRFLLGKKGKKTLICCGVNPSTASPNDLDPTMKNIDALAKTNGYDSYLMINLYPMRATNPNDMHEVMDEKIVEKNLEYIAQVLASTECDIWGAWGNLIKTRKYLKYCLEKIIEISDTYQCNWYTIGQKTKEGHPHHPLYLNRECKTEPFDIHEYVKKMR